jgi:hypothetical protein
MTSTADLASDYFDARLDFHNADNTADREAAADRAALIVDQADRLGLWLDEIGVDDDARVAANGGKPLSAGSAS